VNINYIAVSNIAQKCIESKIDITHERRSDRETMIPSPYKGVAFL